MCSAIVLQTNQWYIVAETSYKVHIFLYVVSNSSFLLSIYKLKGGPGTDKYIWVLYSN